jgi:hypothetical protein
MVEDLLIEHFFTHPYYVLFSGYKHEGLEGRNGELGGP